MNLSNRRLRSLVGAMFGVAWLTVAMAPAVVAQSPEEEEDAPLPVRLSFLQGSVSFRRAGGDAWVAAQLNTPLAPGDHVYAAKESRFELQFGPDSFVRGDASTDLVVQSIDPDYVQFRVSNGTAALDIRSFDNDAIIELTTPHVALSTRRAGYYRVEVGEETTLVVARRGGDAELVGEGGDTWPLGDGEQVVVDTRLTAPFHTYRATAPDVWDEWNWERTDRVLAAESSRHLPRGVYGGEVLDEYGTWREVPEYGRVWYPRQVAPGWVPYSAGNWIWDAGYGWTWIDSSPWGWAPFHYGRWVHVHNGWGWAPGPLVRRPFYSPAVVGFLTPPRVGLSIAIGVPPISWVALSWGEPLIPWWGRPGFIGAPCWRGWGGPRIVNRVVINNNYYSGRIDRIVYQNTRVRDAVLMLPRDRFGRGRMNQVGRWRDDVDGLRPVRGSLPVRPTHASLAPRGPRGGAVSQPPRRMLDRTTVATRRPVDPLERLGRSGVRVDAQRSRSSRVVVPERFQRQDSRQLRGDVADDPRRNAGGPRQARSGDGDLRRAPDRALRQDLHSSSRPDARAGRDLRSSPRDPASQSGMRDRVGTRRDWQTDRPQRLERPVRPQRPDPGQRSDGTMGTGDRRMAAPRERSEPAMRYGSRPPASRDPNAAMGRPPRVDRPSQRVPSYPGAEPRMGVPSQRFLQGDGETRSTVRRAPSMPQAAPLRPAPRFESAAPSGRRFEDRGAMAAPRVAPREMAPMPRPRDMGMRGAGVDRAPSRPQGSFGRGAASGGMAPSGRGERDGSRRGSR